MKVHVIIKEPQKNPRTVYISNTITNIERTINGDICFIKPASDLIIVYNKYARESGSEYCCKLFNVDFYGTLIMFGGYEESTKEFKELEVGQRTIKDMFPMLWNEKQN